jgi:acyl carrier protein phosphodiesterase
MNFLGHFYLSGDSDSLIVGNFIADFVKGKRYTKYPKEIAEGIIMHRSIDHFTDQHAMFKQSRSRLRPEYGLYSGVIVDMFYDHMLAKNWHEYSDAPLLDYSLNIYSVIEENWNVLPVESQYMFPYMRDYNWLLRYAEIDGIHRSLRGMTQRTKYPSKMDKSIKELGEHFDDFQEEFKEFFEDIREEFRVK